jgi:hypothetical protein
MYLDQKAPFKVLKLRGLKFLQSTWSSKGYHKRSWDVLEVSSYIEMFWEK